MTKRRSSLATKGRSKKFTAFTAEPASWEKKIDDLPGIGQKTSAKLKDKGIEYVSVSLIYNSLNPESQPDSQDPRNHTF